MTELEQETSLFLSYVEADRSWAEWIAWQAEQAGYTVILRAWDFQPGDNEVHLIDKAIKSARHVLLVLSPEYFSTQGTIPHWTTAFARGTVLPILVRACRPDLIGLLGSVLPLDLTGHHTEEHAREILLSGLRRERAKPGTSPIFPSILSHRPDFPLPAIWNVPHQRNPFFLGREEVFDALRRALVPGGRMTALTQAISGLGGIGKTQVAAEYAHRSAQEYEAVLWVQADSEETLTSEYLQLATQVLGLPEQQEADIQVEAVKRWLRTHHRWLLVLDNVEHPQKQLSMFLPSQHQGCVLITTRMRDVGPLARSEVLPLLSQEEAVLLLLRRAKRIALHASIEDARPAEVAVANELCQVMDGLPLALDQAGAYIAEHGCSVQRYRELYEHARPKLLDRRGSGDHPDSVLMTFWLSWEQLQQRNTLAGNALVFCAYLAADRIPEWLLQAGIMMSESSKTPDEVELDEAVGLLYRYSLMERADQTLSLHRLVQEVTQEVLSHEEQQQWMQRAVLVVNAAFPDGEHGTWPQCEALLPHALVCAKWTSILKQNKREGGHLLLATGRYLYERGQYRQAEPLYRRALQITEEQLGAFHPGTGSSLNNLATLYQAQGRYGKAEPLYRRALQITEEQLGAFHPNTASSLNNLATLYELQGRYQEAEPLYLRALRIREKQLGAAHPDTAQILNNLAAIYERQGRYEEAEPFYLRALRIREKQLGAAHPTTATSLNNLALLYRLQGRYEEAEPLYLRALRIREEQLGAVHPDTATSLNNLATLYGLQGRYEKAEPLYLRALAVYEEQLGAAHPSTAGCLNNLAGLYESQGRYEEAEPLYLRALRIREEQLGAVHPDTATSLNNLAFLYRVQGRYQEAEPFYLRALTITEEQLGTEHPQTQQIAANYFTCLAEQYTNRDLDALLRLFAQRAGEQ